MTNWAHNMLEGINTLRDDALTHLLAQRWAEAADCLQLLATIHPQEPWVRQWQVITAMALGQPEAAVDAAQAALQPLPDSAHAARADVCFNLGQALAQLGRRTEALAAFDQALALNPALECAAQARNRLLAQPD